MGITRPNFGDLNPFRYYTTTSDYVSGNPDLKPSIAHNAELSYSFKSIYAVLYNSYNRNAIGYVTRFNEDGSQYSMPENCMDNNKVGIYASYYRSIFDWWNVNINKKASPAPPSGQEKPMSHHRNPSAVRERERERERVKLLR